MKRVLMNILIDEIFYKPANKTYPINGIIYNHIDEIWSIDLVDMIE